MPRSRSKAIKQPKRGMYIVCEGARDHSEYAYLNGFLHKNGLKIPSLKLVLSNKNNPVGLVNDIIKERETSEDILWVVFDNDNHADLDDAIQLAKLNGVNVALSAISFEVWIYLHFDCTTRLFNKSEEVIKAIKSRFGYNYKKDNKRIFSEVGEKIDKAYKNAESLRKDRTKNCTGVAKHHWNPYTNFDQLLEAIKNFVQEETGGKKTFVDYDLPY